jgi:glyceraldehyde-3-phosphate dehydrogenase [NAD(P)+]
MASVNLGHGASAKSWDPPRLERLLEDDLFRPIVSLNEVGVPVFKNYLGGKWVEGEHHVGVDSPIDGSIIAGVPQCGAAEAEGAVTAAHNARRAIRDLPGHARLDVFEKAAALLKEHQSSFAEALLLEAGKPHHDQQGETKAAAERLRATRGEATHIYGEYLPGDWAADTVGKMALVVREPLGVVACIGPFNYPLFIPTAKIAPALLAGNTVVAKSSSQTPLSLLMLARVLEEAGLPPGTLNVITGTGGTVGEALVRDERVRMVSFTGSTDVGKRIHAMGGLKRFHLELGGKGHALVFDDADPAMAAAKSVEGACKNAGQRCDAVSAVVVQESIAEEFTEAAIKASMAWKAGDPRAHETKVGPLITDRAADRVQELIREAQTKGARLLAGGERRGRLLTPAVLAGVTPDMRIAHEETFGPVVPILEAPDEEGVIQLATRTPYGLDSCVFTRSFERMWRAAKRLSCGEVTINDLPKHGIGHFPFGGQRESGMGREGIGYSVDEMTELKTIVFTLGPKPGA